jgi:hypothetical protein
MGEILKMVKVPINGVIRLPDGRIMKLRDADELGLLTWSRVENWLSSPRAKTYRTAYFANWYKTPNASWEVSRQTYMKRMRKRLK